MVWYKDCNTHYNLFRPRHLSSLHPCHISTPWVYTDCPHTGTVNLILLTAIFLVLAIWAVYVPVTSPRLGYTQTVPTLYTQTISIILTTIFFILAVWAVYVPVTSPRLGYTQTVPTLKLFTTARQLGLCGKNNRNLSPQKVIGKETIKSVTMYLDSYCDFVQSQDTLLL